MKLTQISPLLVLSAKFFTSYHHLPPSIKFAQLIVDNNVTKLNIGFLKSSCHHAKALLKCYITNINFIRCTLVKGRKTALPPRILPKPCMPLTFRVFLENIKDSSCGRFSERKDVLIGKWARWSSGRGRS